MKFKLLPLAAILCGHLQAATYYVATTGLDTADGISAPVKTIHKGISKLVKGDTLIVKPGVYEGRDNFIQGVPSGTSAQPTTVKAEVPYTVRISSNKPLLYIDNEVQLNGDWTKVDGFVFNLEATRYPPYNGSIGGNYNKITRSIFRRAGQVDAYGGWLEVNGSYNLVEDVAGVGAARYGFKTGGTTSTASFNIFRRVVGRFDYSGSNQPKATFNHYGNNSGWLTNGIVFQNCISLDGQQSDYYGGTSGFKAGGFQSIKNSGYDLYQGNIVLNEQDEYDAYWIDGKNATLDNNIAWGTYKGDYGHIVPNGIWVRDGTTGMQVLNSTVADNEGALPIKAPTGTKLFNNLLDPSAKDYIPVPDKGTTTGATIMYRYGRAGSLYGEPGYDELTNIPLWPFPGEAEIKAVFAEPNPVYTGYTPPDNDTTRGFAAKTDPFGKPQTLTSYIWQFLGKPIPPEIYGTTTPPCSCP